MPRIKYSANHHQCWIKTKEKPREREEKKQHEIKYPLV